MRKSHREHVVESSNNVCKFVALQIVNHYNDKYKGQTKNLKIIGKDEILRQNAGKADCLIRWSGGPENWTSDIQEMFIPNRVSVLIDDDVVQLFDEGEIAYE